MRRKGLKFHTPLSAGSRCFAHGQVKITSRKPLRTSDLKFATKIPGIGIKLIKSDTWIAEAILKDTRNILLYGDLMVITHKTLLLSGLFQRFRSYGDSRAKL